MRLGIQHQKLSKKKKSIESRVKEKIKMKLEIKMKTNRKIKIWLIKPSAVCLKRPKR